MDDIPVPLPAVPTRFMDRFRAFIRARHLAYRTEKTYCSWVREFIRFHNKRHPESMGAEEVNAWLSHLANNRNVAVNTQKTALNAVVFMYHQFLGKKLGDLQFTNTSRGRKLPTVFSHEEAMSVLSHMHGTHKEVPERRAQPGLRGEHYARAYQRSANGAGDPAVGFGNAGAARFMDVSSRMAVCGQRKAGRSVMMQSGWRKEYRMRGDQSRAASIAS